MVDCVDRITLRLTEWLLQPLQQLRDQETPSAVTLRPPSRGRRVLVRITKSWPDGPAHPARHSWLVRELTDPAFDTPESTWTDPTTYDDPEDAYWAAAAAIATARRS